MDDAPQPLAYQGQYSRMIWAAKRQSSKVLAAVDDGRAGDPVRFC